MSSSYIRLARRIFRRARESKIYRRAFSDEYRRHIEYRFHDSHLTLFILTVFSLVWLIQSVLHVLFAKYRLPLWCWSNIYRLAVFVACLVFIFRTLPEFMADLSDADRDALIRYRRIRDGQDENIYQRSWLFRIRRRKKNPVYKGFYKHEKAELYKNNPGTRKWYWIGLGIFVVTLSNALNLHTFNWIVHLFMSLGLWLFLTYYPKVREVMCQADAAALVKYRKRRDEDQTR